MSEPQPPPEPPKRLFTSRYVAKVRSEPNMANVVARMSDANSIESTISSNVKPGRRITISAIWKVQIAAQQLLHVAQQHAVIT